MFCRVKKKLKNDLDVLLQAKTLNNKSNDNYYKKSKTQKTDFKQFWWVVVLIAVGAFLFICTQPKT